MSVKRGYKQTDVGVIPEEWDVETLAAVTERVMVGIASAATHAYRPRGVPLFRNQNIKANLLDDSDLLFVDAEYEKVFRNKRLKPGDLLTARTGYPGVTCVVPSAYEDAQSFTTLITRPKKERVDSEYLCQFVNSRIGQAFFERSQIGGAQKNVNVATLRLMPVPVPLPIEQRAIAAALSDVEALIDSLARLIAKKRDLKQAAMQQLLTGQTRLPGFGGKGGYKHALLDSVARRGSGHTPDKKHPEYWGGKIKWVSLKDSERLDSLYISDTADKITPAGIANSSAVEYPPGVVVLSRDAGVGKSAITQDVMAVSQHFMAWQCGPQLQNHDLYYWLQSRKPEFERIAIGNTIKTIGLPYFKALMIPLPSTEEQSVIAAILTDMDAEISALEQRRNKTKLVKQGMMQELLTGRTRLG